VSLSLSGFQVPTLTGKVSSTFGPRTHPVTGEKNSMHNGIDITAPEGTPVMASKEGKIEAVNQNSETGGKIVYIRHDDGSQTRYMHLSKILIDKVGMKIFARTVIGLVGHTGRSTGDHLHFEVRDSFGAAIDPGPLFGLKQYAAPTTVGEVMENIPLGKENFLPVIFLLIGATFLLGGSLSWASH
jgi:murein DD-endopeptidase MepM/ murein hydrolase activator NlpD